MKRDSASARAFLVEASPILQELKRVQRRVRAIQSSDGDGWPTLEYWIEMEWLLEASEVLTELLGRYCS